MSTSDRHGNLDHGRLSAAEDAFAGATMLSSKDDVSDELTDISAGQKMLSAISGSLLTSLLGMRS